MGLEVREEKGMTGLRLGLQDPLPNLPWFPPIFSPLAPHSLCLVVPSRPCGARGGAPWTVAGNTACCSHQASLLLQVEYLLKKVLSSMSLEVGLGELEELLAQEAQAAQTSGGLSVWQFLELFNSGRCLRGVGRDTLSMAIHEVYQELIQDVLKQVRPSWELEEDPQVGWGVGGYQ